MMLPKCKKCGYLVHHADEHPGECCDCYDVSWGGGRIAPKFKDVISPFSQKWLPASVIFLTKRGSLAYGTSTKNSDCDINGVAIPPDRYFLGFSEKFEQAQTRIPSLADPLRRDGVNRDVDVAIHDIRKFFNLAAKCNPNIIELLFVPEECVLISSPAWEHIRDNRNEFLSQNALFTFTGYANAQLKRLLVKGRRLSTAGQSRKSLIKEHGFDTKDAMHLIRTARMNKEILQTGQINVFRPDREELLAIREGKRSMEDIVAEAESLLNEAETAKNSCTLPETPNYKKLDEICIQAIELFNQE